MPDGELRRPPQLWEQRLTRMTSVLSVGLGTSGATSIVEPTPAPGGDSGVEPAPVLPPPGEFIKPSTPSLVGQVQGINVIWDGLNSAGDLWPYDTSWVEVHLDTTGTAFTPGTATLQGRLSRPGNFYLGGLSSGTAYYVKLMGADPAGNYTDPSDAATGYTGLTTSGDYGTATIGSGAVSFDARAIGGVTTTVGTATPSGAQDGDIWLDTTGGATTHKRYNGSIWETQAWGSSSLSANCITATQMAAGAVTAGAIAAGAVTTDKLTAGTINGFYITGSTIAAGYLSGGTISGGYISGGTVNGAVLTSASIPGYATDGDIAGFITAAEVNGNVTSISGGVITSGTIIGRSIQTSSSSTRAVLGDGAAATLDFYYAGALKGYVTGYGSGLQLYGNSYVNVLGDLSVGGAITTSSNVAFGLSSGNVALRVDSSGNVYSYGIDNNTTANAANVRVGASAKLLKSTSTQRVKTAMAPLADELPGVDTEKIGTEPASVDPYDVLNVVPTEFQSLAAADADQRILGFIAENVAEAFPWAAEWDEEGLPSSVADRPILAALLQVVKEQQATITALTARIEALEA